MNLRYRYFWNPGVMKRKTIVLPTSTDDLRENAIVGFSKEKPTKNARIIKIKHWLSIIPELQNKVTVIDCTDVGYFYQRYWLTSCI